MIRFLCRFTILFPLFYYLALGWLAYQSFNNPLMIIIVFVHCYLSPVLMFRFFHFFLKFPHGKVDLNPKVIDCMLWVVSYRAQMVFELFQFPEKFLRVIPEVYGWWLTCWGSKVGRNVIWAPNINIYDRATMNIGSNVIIGSGVTISCHAVDRIKGNTVLFYLPVNIGDDVFIGANAVIGPGVVIPSGKKIKFGTIVYQDRVVDFDDIDVTMKKLKSKYLSE